MQTLTKKEVAELLKVSTRTVERNCASGKIPKPFYVGERSPRWSAKAIYALANGEGYSEAANVSR